MKEEEENRPNPIYIVADLVEDILVGLPLKQILRFKTVSKQWRSIIESKSFVERRKRSAQKDRKILAVGDQTEPRFEGDTEIEMLYLQRDDVNTRPSLTCDGLICIPVPDWINVLNLSTREFVRFPSGPSHYGLDLFTGQPKPWWDIFPGNWAMGFGKDEVNGRYKIVRMLFDLEYFEILDVHIGEWQKLSPPPYKVVATRKSACVNGSIYWLDFKLRYKILALDLHTEEFRDVLALPPARQSDAAQIVNLEDRLAIADTCLNPEWRLEIWSMDAQEAGWSMTYSIRFTYRFLSTEYWDKFTPVAITKQGNLYLYFNDKKRLFKYYPDSDLLCCVAPNICVISSFVENLVPLGLQPGCVPKSSISGYRYGLSYLQPGKVPKISTPAYQSRVSSIVGRIESMLPNILLTSSLVSLIIFGYRYKYCT